jgi:hypothetical protein
MGYSRDGKPAEPQIVYGLLCAADGCPVAIEVFSGNTADPTTFTAQVNKIRQRFGIRRVVLVGDRGMITSKRIDEDLREAEGLDWITALRNDILANADDETLWLPLQALVDCEGKKDDLVQFEAAGPGRVTAQWRDGKVPQIVSYDVTIPDEAEKFPVPPQSLTENPPGLLKAFHAAFDVTTPDPPIRFALDCVQLRGATGSIAASDGRQLLVQEGFRFPWDTDVLVSGNGLFGSNELPKDEPVAVGRTGNWVSFKAGRWTVYLAVNTTGRFPDFSKHIPKADDAKARCLISPADASFLATTLPKLPCHDSDNRPITLDLNGKIAIRARSVDSMRPTEVVLTGSSCSGEPVRVSINRMYLARAARLGVRELCIFGEDKALLGSGDQWLHVLMPLEPGVSLPPAEDAIRIESPGTEPEVPTTPTPKRKRARPVSESTNTSGKAGANGHAGNTGQAQATPQADADVQAKASGQAKSNGQARKPKTNQQNIDSLIQQGEALRTSLRDMLLKTNELVNGLKRHRHQNRAVQNTLASLRQLKTLSM